MYNQDLNGSNDKPYPQEGNFVVNPSYAQVLPEQEPVYPALDDGNVPNQFGQVKYARREGAPSIYKDVTRNTENDNQATAKAEGSCIGEDDEEESQGI